MLRTSELDMAETVKASDIHVFLSDAAWAVCFIYHTVLKTSPGAAIFGQDMLFDILFIADWQKIWEHRQQLTDLNNAHGNKGRIDNDYKVGQKVMLKKEGILRNAPSDITHPPPPALLHPTFSFFLDVQLRMLDKLMSGIGCNASLVCIGGPLCIREKVSSLIASFIERQCQSLLPTFNKSRRHLPSSCWSARRLSLVTNHASDSSPSCCMASPCHSPFW